MLLKSRVATNICHWLKVQSRLFKNCIFLDFQISLLYIILSHIIILPYFPLWMLHIFNTIRMSNSLVSDQARHFVEPDLGPNCLQRLSADNKSEQRVKYKKLVDTTFWLKPRLKLISFGYNFFPFG